MDQPDRTEIPYARSPQPVRPGASLGAAEIIALALSVLWVIAAALFFWILGEGNSARAPLQAIMVLLAVLLPVALIWVAAFGARTARDAADEAAYLRAEIAALRHDQQAVPRADAAPDLSQITARLDQITDGQDHIEVALAQLRAHQPQPERPVAPPPPPRPEPDDQAMLELGSVSEETGPALAIEDYITALQFPADPDDKEGFRALRRVLKHRPAAQLITAAQDVLTLLSQSGLYMDDLGPGPLEPEMWRHFARGDRHSIDAVLERYGDDDALEACGTRMRNDTIYRDACHHFLRLFDHTLSDIEGQMTDMQIRRLMDTRTARAFMLLGRVVGVFG